MTQSIEIHAKWVQNLFENDQFKNKLKQFLENNKQNINQHPSQILQKQLNFISDQISGELFNSLQNLASIQIEHIAQQMTKIKQQIKSIRNTVFQSNQKLDLQTTSYNKSKLQFSSILQQDIGSSQITEFKSTIQDLKQKFNDLFVGSQIISKNTFLIQNLNQSPLSKFINKKCTDLVVGSQKKQLKRMQASQLIMQKRMQQISKTLNNVLQMLNESNSKKLELSKQIENQPTSAAKVSSNQPSLLRQSSLQNLKIKNFFTFGNK